MFLFEVRVTHLMEPQSVKIRVGVGQPISLLISGVTAG